MYGYTVYSVDKILFKIMLCFHVFYISQIMKEAEGDMMRKHRQYYWNEATISSAGTLILCVMHSFYVMC